MKKFIFVSLFLAASVLTYAETDDTKTETNVSKTSVSDSDFSHWSIAIGGGANLMLGENTTAHIEDAFGDYLKKNTNWAVKAEFEYMINPVFGFNLHYMYDPYNKTNANANGYTTDRDLQMHEVTAQFVLNVLNLGKRTRVHTNWNWFAGLGAGVLCYQRNQDYDYSIRPAAMVIASTSVEYSPISSLGIFAEGILRWYADDRVNGITAGQLKDMGLYGGLGLRYHIGASKKNHVRVINMNTYEPLSGSGSVEASCCREVESLQAQVDDLTRQIKAMGTTPATTPVVAAAPATSSISGADVKAQIDSAVNAATSGLRGDVRALDQRVSNLENGNFNTADDATIYFDVNSATVSHDYQLLIAKIAKRMHNNNSEKIVIRGYCDYRGDVPTNKALAQKRIDAVIYILVNRYRIDKSRIATECIGRVEGEEEFDLLNRRCDIVFK